ncbi:MAG: endoglucanase [Clostridiales bacterium]|nr:endoglucanase [Clostridiales bacterium]
MKKAVILLILITMLIGLCTTGAYALDIVANNDVYIVNGKISDGAVRDFEENDIKIITPISEQYNKYTDYPHGYSLHYPNHMYIDVHLSEVRTVIFDEELQIEIYYDDLNNTPATAWNYIYYSNEFINNKADHIKEYEESYNKDGSRIHILKWSRSKLARVGNDKNYYLCAEIFKNNKQVYTIFFKSTVPLEDAKCKEIINSMKIIEKKGKAYTDRLPEYDVSRNWNDETKAFYEKYFVDSDKLTWGIFDDRVPDYLEYFTETENKLNYKFECVVRYQNLPSSQGIDAIKNALEKAYNDGRYVELTLQTIRQTPEEGNIMYDILNGEYDVFFNEYAVMLREFRHPVLFRLDNEMNGDWCLYSAYHTSKDTLIYKEVYKYIHKIFKDNNVDNVIWVWNPHDKSFPNFKWNDALMYYPGDSYVDVVGLTGYNTGTYYQGEIWRGFTEIYDELYTLYDRLYNKPFMITEFSSSSIGGDKEAWIKEMFQNITRYERIKAAIWWNGCDYDSHGNAARIYRLDESISMMKLFQDELQKFRQ